MRTPMRRSLGLSVVLLVVGVLMWRTTQDSWYLGAFRQNGSWAWIPLDPATLASHGVIPSPTGERPALYTVFGVPAPLAWLGAAVVVGLIAHLSRLGLLALAAAGAAWMARSSVVALDSQLSATPELAKRFVSDGGAMTQYLEWSWVLMGVLVLSAAQITYAAHVERRQREISGDEVEPNLLDTFHSIQTSAASRFSRPPGPAKSEAPTAGTTAQ